jgi:hypothetical protein
MHREKKRVMIGAEAEEDEAEERSCLKIERPAGFLASEPVEESLLEVRNQGGKIDQWDRDVAWRVDDLDRLSVTHLEAGAQGLVATDDLAHRAPETGRIESAAEADGGEQTEAGRARFELFQKPEALLGERERRRSGILTPLDRLVSEKLGLAVAELPEEKLARSGHSPSASATKSGLPCRARRAWSQRSIPKATHPEKAG